MVSAGLVQANGLAALLWSRMVRAMASCRLDTDLKTPRRMRLQVMEEKRPSTALIQDAEVGVKWKTQHG